MTRALVNGRSRVPAGRRGGGLIIGIVAMVLLILLLLGLREVFVSSTVLDEVAAEHLGSLALTLAESALEELQFSLRREVNDAGEGGGTLFALFRTPARYETEAGPSLPSLVSETPRTRALLREAPYAAAGFELWIAPPRVVYRAIYDAGRPFNYHENYGLIRYRVVVRSHGVRPAVERTLEAEQEFKVVAVGVPRPFDQVALFLARPEAINGGVETNTLARDIQARRADWIARLNSTLANPALQPLAAGIQALRDRFEEIPELEEIGPDTHPNPRKVCPFVFPMLAFLPLPSAADGQAVALRKVDLAMELKGRLDEIRVLDDQARNAVAALAASRDDPRKALERVAGDLGALARRAGETMRAIRRWQRFVGHVWGDAYGALGQDLARVQPEFMRRRASFVVRPAASRESPRDALTHLLNTIERTTGERAVTGTVYVDAPDAELDLSGLTLAGRLVIATPGRVRLGNTKAAAGDRLVIVAGGDVTIDGAVGASLIALRDVWARQPATIAGTLVVFDVHPGALDNVSLIPDPSLLSGDRSGGKVRYDARYLYVSIAPSLRSRRVERSRPIRGRSERARH